VLGRDQYPVSPADGPSLGLPSGQRGVGREGRESVTGLIERQCFGSHRKHAASRAKHNGISPDLPASVACHGALNGDGIAMASANPVSMRSVPVPAGFQFNRPADWLCRVRNVHQDMHVGLDNLRESRFP